MLRSLLMFFGAFILSGSVFALDNAYFEIKKIKVIEMSPMPGFVNAGSECLGLASEPANLNRNVLLDRIVNIGKTSFNVIQAGEAVMNVNIDKAHALPSGVICGTELTGWNAPQEKIYHIQYENLLGMTVVDFTYGLAFTAGGSFNGIGKYITNATIIPYDVDVAWGWSLDVEATVPSVFNTGSKEHPVAGMQLNIGWKVSTSLTYSQVSYGYYISGNNSITELE